MVKVKEKTTIIVEDHDTTTDQLQIVSGSTMTRYTALLFATACGMAVANIYYAQPLLDSLATEFGIAHSSIGIVITITQLCYALGLLLLVPLGDLLNRRRLIVGQMLLSVLSLIVVGIAPIITVLFTGLGRGRTACRGDSGARSVRIDFGYPSRSWTYSRLGAKRSRDRHSARTNIRWCTNRSRRLAFGLSSFCRDDAHHDWRVVPSTPA